MSEELKQHVLRSVELVRRLQEVVEGFVIEYDPEVPEEHRNVYHDADLYLIDTATLLQVLR
jgi:hypothetical protein